MRGKQLFILTFLLILQANAFTQSKIDSTEKADATSRNLIYDLSLTAYPLLGFLPETSWSFGGGGVTTFRFRGSSPESKPSTTSLLALYTLKKQWIFLMPYDYQFDDNKKRLSGEVGYFDYFFNFYGFGTDVSDEDLETYTSNLFRLIAQYDQQISGPHFVGLSYNLDYFFNPGYDPEGKLENTRPIGYEMGVRTGVGIRYRYDTRDNYLYPSKGIFITTEGLINTKYIGSDYDCTRFSLMASYFQKIKGTHILAFNFSTSHYSQNTPFFELPFLSKPMFMRGYADRKFMDNHMAVVQMEYRFPIIWRFRGTVFTSYGTVADSIGLLGESKWRWSYGVGLRFVLNQKEKLNIRLDYGIGHGEDSNFYLTIGEVF